MASALRDGYIPVADPLKRGADTPWRRADLQTKEARNMSEHKGEEMKGRVKEAVGDATGDKDLQRAGKIDQASAATKQAVDRASDAVKDAIGHEK